MLNLIELYKRFPTEEACNKYLEEQRWREKIVCPHCNHDVVYRFKDGKYFKCKACRLKFTVRVGTIFEDSHLPLQKWFFAIYILNSLKKGISSIQLAKYLGITQKSAWFVLHRIRIATEQESFLKLAGVVEADETYQGGAREGKRGRGAENKTKIFGLKEREGNVRMQVVDDVKRNTLLPIIKDNVEAGSLITTDELLTYASLDSEGYSHETVNHAKGEFVNGIAHTNGLENTWSHFKRGINAIQIHISKKHTNKYLAEYSFRLNSKNLSDFDRFTLWFSYCAGKKITYKTLTKE